MSEDQDDAADADEDTTGGDSAVSNPEAEFYGDVDADADANSDPGDGANADDTDDPGTAEATDAETDGPDRDRADTETDDAEAEDDDGDGVGPEADDGDAGAEADDSDAGAEDDGGDAGAEADDGDAGAEDDGGDAEAEDDDGDAEAEDDGDGVGAEADDIDDAGVGDVDDAEPDEVDPDHETDGAAESAGSDAGAPDEGETESTDDEPADAEVADAAETGGDGTGDGEAGDDEADPGTETVEAGVSDERGEGAPTAAADGEASAGMLAGSAASGGGGVTVTDPDAEFYTDPLVGDDSGSADVAVPPDAEHATGVDESALQAAATALWRGELVVYPTETVYGLAADALDERAVRRVFEAKGRDRSNPVSIAVPDVTTALEYVAPSTRTRRFMRAFLPGPVTVVCGRRSRVPDAVTGGRDRVGVRIPDDPTAIALLRRVAPLTATSANRSGTENARRVADLDPEVREAVAVVLDGGETPGGESTVVDVDRGAVIRAGERGEAVREWLDEH